MSNKSVADPEKVLGLYIVGRPDPEIRQLENAIIAERKTQQLRIVSASSLQPNGNGKQGVYVTEVSETGAQVLAGLIGAEAQPFIAAVPVGTRMRTSDDLDIWGA